MSPRDPSAPVLRTLVIASGSDGLDLVPETLREGLSPQDLRHATLPELSRDLLDAIRPDLILSALLERGFDAIDVAGRLAELNYSGRYLVVAPGLPRPDLVRQEVASLAPGLDFDLLMVPPGTGPLH